MCNEATKQMIELFESIAAGQRSASTEFVPQNYLSEAEKRRYSRESVDNELNYAFRNIS
jgi:hypothetical protein